MEYTCNIWLIVLYLSQKRIDSVEWHTITNPPSSENTEGIFLWAWLPYSFTSFCGQTICEVAPVLSQQ